MKIDGYLKHPRSGLPPTVLYKSSYLHYIYIFDNCDEGWAFSSTCSLGYKAVQRILSC